MSVSTSYTGPVITYDANGDGGVPMLFAESATAVDPAVTAAMEAKVEDLTPYRNALKDVIDACALIPLGTGLNQYTETSEYTTALSAAETVYADGSATKSDLQTATSDLETAIAGLSINLPTTGKFYRIKGYSNNYITSNSASSNASMNGTASANNIVYYSAEGNLVFFGSGFGLYNTSIVAPAGNTLNAYTFSQGAQMGKYYVTSNASGVGQYCYDNTSNGSKLDRNGSAVTSGSYQTDWTLEEITTLPVTITSAGYATLYSPVALTIPTGVTAYIASDEGNYLHLTAIENSENVIPANTGVILAGNANTYDFTVTTTETTVSGNVLTGSVAAISRPENSYILATGDKGVGFYKDGATTIPGFKAYLQASAGVKGFLSFDFGTEDAIESIVNDQLTKDNAAIFNLAGQRISKLQKGVNIVNGKKVLVK